MRTIATFIARRLGSGALAILGVSVLVFAFLHLVPGDPVDQLVGGQQVTPEQRAAVEKCMGLDRSLPAQFALFLGHIVDGTLGHQCKNGNDQRGQTVAARIGEVLPYTIELAIAGMVVAIVLALPLGVTAAVRRGTWVDTAATIGSLVGLSVPNMVLATLALLVFFIDLRWLPGPFKTDPTALILPALAIGTHLMAMLARMTRSSMTEVLGEDYVRTARAKGVGERRVIYRHALRNALLPVITVAGLQFGSLLSGAIIIEKVFARPGLGTTLLDAISERNYPVVQGTVFVIAVIYVIVNILVDVAYGLADPRIRRA
jgi:ABC-type dipeptide/oligopeptide/nickel transport system permease component